MDTITCQVKGCSNPAYMGWQPTGERRGVQICKAHALRHRDPRDGFNLFDAFRFTRRVVSRKPSQKKAVHRADRRGDDGGRHRQSRATAHSINSSGREESQERQTVPGRQASPPAAGEPGPGQRQCADCGNERQAGHRYCRACSAKRAKESNRLRQRRHRKRAKNTVSA